MRRKKGLWRLADRELSVVGLRLIRLAAEDGDGVGGGFQEGLLKPAIYGIFRSPSIRLSLKSPANEVRY